MQNKTIEPLVFLVIVGAIFSASLFVILQGEELFNKELRASVSQVTILKPRAELGMFLTRRAKGQAQEKLLSDCFDQAYETFEQNWNQKCQEKGLEDKCDLERYIADELKKEYEESKQNCY